MNKYYECQNCGMVVQGFEASRSVRQHCEDWATDHRWVEFDPGDESDQDDD